MASYPKGKWDELEACAQGHGTCIADPLIVLVLSHEIAAVAFEDLPELGGIVLLQDEERRVVGEAFGDPLIVIAVPEDQVAPPLMRGFVDQDLAVERARDGIKMQIGLFLRAEEREARRKTRLGHPWLRLPGICVRASEL